MKKIIAIFVFSIFINSAVAQEQPDLITDEIMSRLEYNLAKESTVPYKHKEYSPIQDELVENRKFNDSAFHLEVLKEEPFENIFVDDELVSVDFIKSALNTKIPHIEKADDEFIEKITNPDRVRKIKPKTKYDFTKKIVSVPIKLTNGITSTKNFLEGDTIPFVTTQDCTIKGRTFEKGTTILGRIETISASDKMGTPENIKIDNFYIDSAENINLHGSVSKSGANRSIWVYPLYQAGNICFWVAGFVFVPIHGGRVKLSSNDIFTIYYEE